MKTTVVKWALLGVVLLSSARSSGEEQVASDAYEQEILQWRIERLANLKAPSGYLNLVGLYWLENGTTLIGAATDNDIVFPDNAAPYVGELQVKYGWRCPCSTPGCGRALRRHSCLIRF